MSALRELRSRHLASSKSGARLASPRPHCRHSDGTQKMLKRTLAILIATAMSAPLSGAAAEDLIQIYRDALASDPVLASARSTWTATLELVPQARAGILPAVNLGANANEQDFHDRLRTDPTTTIHERFSSYAYTVSASQPLYRPQNSIALSQARRSEERR